MKKISTIPFYHIRPGQIGTTFYFFLKINRSTSSNSAPYKKGIGILFHDTILSHYTGTNRDNFIFYSNICKVFYEGFLLDFFLQ